MLFTSVGVCESASSPEQILQVRVDSSRRPPPVDPANVRPHVKASEADSLAAQKMAWLSIRGMSHSTGTKEYRARKALNGPNMIVEALKVIPGDEWLNAMRLRRPVPGAPPASSRASRAMCGASPWWCDMLFFFGLYRTDSVALMDSVLQAGVANMPPNVRCVWGDVFPLIADGATRRKYERLPCAARAEFQDRLWWLADPLHTTPGNERRAEHFAREVNTRLTTESYLTGIPGPMWALAEMRRGTHKMHAADLLTEAGKREMEPGITGLLSKRIDGFLDRAHYVRGHANPLADRAAVSLWDRMLGALRHQRVASPPRSYAATALAFVPSAAAISEPLRAEPSHWQLAPRTPHESAWSPVGNIVPIDHQHGFFRRGDSSRLVVVTDVSGEPAFTGALVNAALARSRTPYENPAITRHGGAGPRYAFSPIVPADSMLVSVEIIAINRGAARTRFGASPAPASSGRLQISDVVLLDAAADGATGGAQLESILPRILPTTRLRRGSAAGLFWEVYGLNAGEHPEITVVAIREQEGILSRAISGVLGGGARAELSTRFTDVAAAGSAIEGRTVVINLSSLPPARYRLELRVGLPGEQPAVATRAFEIVRS